MRRPIPTGTGGKKIIYISIPSSAVVRFVAFHFISFARFFSKGGLGGSTGYWSGVAPRFTASFWGANITSLPGGCCNKVYSQTGTGWGFALRMDLATGRT
jgi:hypothetical protein